MNTKALHGHNLFLTLYEESDFESMYQYNLDPEIEQYAGGIYPMNRKELQDFIEKELESGNLIFVVRKQSNKKIIGYATISDINQRNQTAEIGLAIGEKSEHKKGYGTEIVQILEHYCFEILSLRKIKALVYSFNEASIKLFEKCDFSLCGKHIAERLWRGKYYDHIFFEKFRDKEYQNSLGESEL